MIYGWLHEIPPETLQTLINKLREEYGRLKIRENSGESIKPDTNPHQRNARNKDPRTIGYRSKKIR